MTGNKLRILYITGYYKPAYIYGGPVRSISALCEGMASQGASVTVFSTDINGPARLSVLKGQPNYINGVEVWYFPVCFDNNPFFSKSLYQAIDEHVGEYDIVIAETLWGIYHWAVITSCRRFRIPYVVPIRGQLLPYALLQKKYKKRIFLELFGKRFLNHAAALHCTDPQEAQAVDALGLNPPIFVVPNGIDINQFTPNMVHGLWRSRLNIPVESSICLFLGRLHPKKRPDLAIRALAEARNMNLDTYLIIAGPDESSMKGKLQSLATDLGVADYLYFIGMLDPNDLTGVFADTDLLLMPSEPQSENFGMAAAEALVNGVPVLVSDGIPFGKWVDEQEIGRMVESSSGSFPQNAAEMLSQPLKLKKMGEKGKILAREKFDIVSISQQMLIQLDAIIKTGKPL